MGKHSDRKKDKKKKDKEKKKKRRHHSSSDSSDSEVEYSRKRRRYEDSEEASVGNEKSEKKRVSGSESDSGREEKKSKKKKSRKERKESSNSDSDKERKSKKKKRRKEKKSKSSSSSESESEDGNSESEKREKKSKKKSESSSAKMNTNLLGTKITEKDYESIRMKFKVWLGEEEKLPISEVEAKNDLLMSYFGKFTKLWNEDKLPAIYYHKVEEEKQEKVSYGKVMGPAAVPKEDASKFAARGDDSLSDRYLLGNRDVPWISKRVAQIRNRRGRRDEKLSQKAEAYQQKEREKMEDFKKVMGLT